MDIVARRGNDEHQRLLPGISGAFCQNIEQLIVRLIVQLIKTKAVDGKSVFGFCIRRKHLIKTVRWFVNNPLLGLHDLASGSQCRT